jgi:Effector Associated Constant Component 1
MELALSVSGPDQIHELASLEEWLIEDPELRACRITRKAPKPRPGEMGGISDVLVVALGSGGAGAALATSLSIWLRTRVNRVSVRLKTDKGEIEVQANGTGEVADQVRKIIGSSGVGAS